MPCFPLFEKLGEEKILAEKEPCEWTFFCEYRDGRFNEFFL
jgi:hypothetical protein